MSLLKLALGAFTRAGVDVVVGGGLAATTGAALDHYAGQLEAMRATREYPRFRRGPAARGEVVDLEPPVCAGTIAALEREAREQNVDFEHLVEHALLVYLADLDSRRTAAPID